MCLSVHLSVPVCLHMWTNLCFPVAYSTSPKDYPIPVLSTPPYSLNNWLQEGAKLSPEKKQCPQHGLGSPLSSLSLASLWDDRAKMGISTYNALSPGFQLMVAGKEVLGLGWG